MTKSTIDIANELLAENAKLKARLVALTRQRDSELAVRRTMAEELARRNAAAGKPVAYRWEGKGSGKTCYDGVKPLGVDSQPLFTDAPPATELQAENARLRQQRDAANAQIQFLNELLQEGLK